MPAVMLNGFEIPRTGGIFIEPERKGGAARLMADLDLGRLWNEVKAKIAGLGSPPRRGRRPSGRR